MNRINWKRVWIGTVVGFIGWAAWSGVCNMVGIGDRYQAAQQAGQFLMEPRYPFFMGAWFVFLFLLSLIVVWLYAAARSTLGAGPKTALLLGVVVGFAIAVPENFAMAAWSPASRVFPLWWMLELWVGAVIAALLGGWLYRD